MRGGSNGVLQELAADKEKMLKIFLSDKTIVDLLTNKTTTPLPALDLRYTQVFPYHWLSSTITEQKSYLCFFCKRAARRIASD